MNEFKTNEVGFQPASRDWEYLLHEQRGWQFGEQGILMRLADEQDCESFCEIGAGNGGTLPVTIEPMIYRDVWPCHLFEKDSGNIKQLFDRYGAFSSVRLDGEFALELYDYRHSSDLVVIDVDGDDIRIMREVLSVNRPKVLMVEHQNLQHEGPAIQATWQELLEVAVANFYELAGITLVNSIYVLNEE